MAIYENLIFIFGIIKNTFYRSFSTVKYATIMYPQTKAMTRILKMLKKFTVRNYRQFNEPLEFDLTAGNYAFNPKCTHNGLVKLALIYGENGTGKSNLGWAIFDLVSHLTDKQTSFPKNFYLNLLSSEKTAKFSYEFIFSEQKNKFNVLYQYEKDEKQIIQSEKLFIKEEQKSDYELVIDYQLGKPFKTLLNGTETLNKSINPNQNLSVVRYVFNNTNLQKRSNRNKVFIQFVNYVDNILSFRNVFDGVQYSGFKIGSQKIEDDIIENNNLNDFEVFLNNFGFNFKLTSIDFISSKKIGVQLSDNAPPVPLIDIISTGTKSLMLFYYWWQEIKQNKIPLLFIDEFDCSYHFELSEKIVEKLKELPNTQVILTTHNTNLLSNELIRPDCGFVIDGKTISSLNKSTNRELREAHNLERLYQAGEFSQ